MDKKQHPCVLVPAGMEVSAAADSKWCFILDIFEFDCDATSLFLQLCDLLMSISAKTIIVSGTPSLFEMKLFLQDTLQLSCLGFLGACGF